MAFACAMAVAVVPARTATALTPSEIRARVESLRADLQDVTRRLDEAERTLGATEGAIRQHAAALRTAATRKVELGGAISRRAAELYMLGTTSFEVIAQVGDPAQYVQRIAYLEEIARGERSMLEEIRTLQKRAETESALLRAARLRAMGQQHVLSMQRQQLAQQLSEWSRLKAFLDASERASRAGRAGGRGIYCPVVGPNFVMDNFGDPRPGGPHQGDDIRADTGQLVRAVLPSVVVDVPYGSWWGIGIVIRDWAGNEWYYAHLAAEFVTVGQQLQAGELIGRVGCTGRCYGPHLHFEFHPGGGPAADPYRILSTAC